MKNCGKNQIIGNKFAIANHKQQAMILVRQRSDLMKYGIPYGKETANNGKSYGYCTIPEWCKANAYKEDNSRYQVHHPSLGRITVDSIDLEFINGNDKWTLYELLQSRDPNFKLLVNEHGVFVSHPDFADEEGGNTQWYELVDVQMPKKYDKLLSHVRSKLNTLRNEIAEHEKSMGGYIPCANYKHRERYEMACGERDVLIGLLNSD